MKPDLERLRARHAAAVVAVQDALDRLTLAKEAAVQAALDGQAIPSTREAWDARREAFDQLGALTAALIRITGEPMEVPVPPHRSAEEILAA